MRESNEKQTRNPSESTPEENFSKIAEQNSGNEDIESSENSEDNGSHLSSGGLNSLVAHPQRGPGLWRRKLGPPNFSASWRGCGNFGRSLL